MPPASRTAETTFFTLRRRVVFDDEAGARGDVGFEVGVDPPRIAGDDLNAGVVQPPGERAAIDEEIDLEAGEQDGIQRADEQFVLADG